MSASVGNQAVKDSKPILPAWQSSLVDQIVKATRNYYYDPAKFKDAKEQEFRSFLIENIKILNVESPQFLSSNLSAAEKTDFAKKVNELLTKFDPHLILAYNPEACAWMADKISSIEKDSHRITLNFDPEVLGQERLTKNHPWWKEHNYGFTETVEGNSQSIPRDIGYVRITDFPDPRWGLEEKEDRIGLEAQKKALAIMDSFRNKRAIVIDLRDSHGGSPEMVEHLISFFIKENGIKINDIYSARKQSTQSFKVKQTPFKLDVPVCILTNNKTFSAAEEFAYDLQQLNKFLQKSGKQNGNRFYIIGQVTQGGAHPMLGYPLVADSTTGKVNDEFLLFVPDRNAINPYTNTNWEDGPKKGVQPDKPVAKDQDALEVAKNMLRSIIERKRVSFFKQAPSVLQDDSDVNANDMSKTAFGQGSNTAKNIKK